MNYNDLKKTNKDSLLKMPYSTLKKQITISLEKWDRCINPNKHTWTKDDYINFFDLLTFNYLRYDEGLYYLNKEVIKSKIFVDIIKYLADENRFIFPNINEKIE